MVDSIANYSMRESSIRDYIALMKPRVMLLVIFTAFCGMVIAPGTIHPVIGFSGILCTTLAAGSAAAINMWSVSYTHLTLPTTPYV